MAESKSSKTWGGRFAKPTDPRMERFSASVHVDGRLWAQDVRGSVAHARMLASQGIVSSAEGEQLVKGLEQIALELESGTLLLDPALEDVHTNIERRLGELVGPLAGKLHTGRSRNDQIATDLLLWMRDQIPALLGALAELRGVLVERAEKEVDVVLPGYTHMQRAQPVRLAHHWLAHYEALTRDAGRAPRRSLANGALAARVRRARRQHAADRPRADRARARLRRADAEHARLRLGARRSARAARGAGHLDGPPVAALRGAGDVDDSSEFGFVELDDAFSTGSSLMPQKKNPDAAELVRGKSGRVIGDLMSLLVT